MTKDPVCGMDIDETKAEHTATYQGQTYYFCSPMCKTKFSTNPAKYAGGGAPSEHGTHEGHGHHHG